MFLHSKVRSALLKFEAHNKNISGETKQWIRTAWSLAIATKVVCMYGAHTQEQMLQVQEVVALPPSRLESGGAASALAEDPSKTIFVSDRESVVVARVGHPVPFHFLKGYILSLAYEQDWHGVTWHCRFLVFCNAD